MRTILILAILTFTALALSPTLALAQTAPQTPPPHPHKVLTPEQIVYQQAMKDYNAQISKLRAAAVAAYSAEMARENAPECPNADNTYATNMCLAHEGEMTDRNYKAVTQALRAMLAMPAPREPGMPTPFVGVTGPEGTPATNTAAFDKAEAAWQAYARAECDATDTYYRGGTIVNSMDGECQLRLARARLHDLDTLYSLTHPN